MGLGNPGSEFEGTRHNVGAEVVQHLAGRHQARLRADRRLRAAVAEAVVGGRRLALAVPSTYMNDSGVAVQALVRRFGLEELDRLVVVHDELDLPPGRVKIKVGGGSGGHNGLRSLEGHLHAQGFVRVRLGIGKPPGRMAGADFVLRRPPRSERAQLDVAVVEAADAVELIASEGVEAAMNRVNAPRP